MKPTSSRISPGPSPSPSAGLRPSAVEVARADFREEAGFLVRLCLFYVMAVALFAAGFAAFGIVADSAWERATHAPRVFAFIWGIYQTALFLPLGIAHGYTRLEFAHNRAMLLPAYAVLLAILMAAGFLIERAAYAALGWPHALSSDTLLFDAPTQLPWIVVHFSLVFTAWITAGALLGAAFYRSGLLGVSLVPVAIAIVGSVESLLDSGRILPGWTRILDAGAPLNTLDPAGMASVLAAAGVYALLIAAGLGLTWAIIRTLPVRATNA